MADSLVPVTRPGTPPDFPFGWAGAAMAVFSIRQIPRPILIALALPRHNPIGIDLRTQTFVWDTPLEDFPPEPAEVLVSTHPIEMDGPGFAGKAQGLDLLLWMIGLHAYPAGRATWLRPGDKYRLKRWPDYDAFPHTPDQLRVIKALAGGLTTVEKAAAKLRLDVQDVQCVVNALSLMGALHRIESSKAAPMQPPVTADYELPDRPRGRHVRRGG